MTRVARSARRSAGAPLLPVEEVDRRLGALGDRLGAGDDAGGVLARCDARANLKPVVGVRLQLDQVGVAELLQVAALPRLHVAVGDLEDAAVLAVDVDVVVALVGVAPVCEVDAAVGAVGELEPRCHGSLAKRKSSARSAS